MPRIFRDWAKLVEELKDAIEGSDATDIAAALAAVGEDDDDTPITNPAAETATVTGLLRGILAKLGELETELQTANGLLDDIKTNTNGGGG